MKVGAPFELVWRNGELTSAGKRPAGFDEEHRMESRIVACEPPRKLAFTWQRGGEVTFELEPRGNKVLLTVVHRRLPDRATMLKVAAGWHAHLDVLVARATDSEPEPFWDRWVSLKDEYERAHPGLTSERGRQATCTMRHTGRSHEDPRSYRRRSGKLRARNCS